MDDRPPPSPSKLRDQFADWTAGNELPGRTMAYLKTGFLPEVLGDLESTDAVSTMLESWAGWESGDIGPAAVLEILRDNDLDTILAELSA